MDTIHFRAENFVKQFCTKDELDELYAKWKCAAKKLWADSDEDKIIRECAFNEFKGLQNSLISKYEAELNAAYKKRFPNFVEGDIHHMRYENINKTKKFE